MIHPRHSSLRHPIFYGGGLGGDHHVWTVVWCARAHFLAPAGCCLRQSWFRPVQSSGPPLPSLIPFTCSSIQAAHPPPDSVPPFPSLSLLASSASAMSFNPQSSLSLSASITTFLVLSHGQP